MTTPVRIAAVSYLNTLPFIYGIEQAASELRAELVLRHPAGCVDELLSGRVDVALVPVAEIPRIPNARIITDYCLGAEQSVQTVVVLSNDPIEALHTIYLDIHSRTSAQLVRILARERWGISPRWMDANVRECELARGEGLVAIGDKVFELAPRYRYQTDLATEWNAHTGAPFVFAAWVAATPRGEEQAERLNAALRYGTEHIAEAITDTWNRSQAFDFDQAYAYLTEQIKFKLDPAKRTAMRLFWEKIITPG